MERREHWERIYSTRAEDAVSWYQRRADRSLQWIRDSGVPKTAAIIDVGGGASTLVDDLLREGYSALTVLDVSAAALAIARLRLGDRERGVTWIEADITDVALAPASFDLWHDRAVFHFLTAAQERKAYVSVLRQALRPGGFAVLATFAQDGPSRCSGLPVVRYTPAALHAELGDQFSLVRQEREEHRTPSGSLQSFLYCGFRRAES